jgi:putative membrane protein
MIKWTILPITALLLAGCATKETESDSTWMGGTSTTSSQESGTSASASASATTDTSSSSSQLTEQDQKFVKEAASGGMAEVEMGKLAAQKGQSEAVKKLGQRLVQDHTKANQELKQIASKKGVTLPTQPASEHKSALDHLKSLQGTEFDKAFTQHAIQDHQKDIQKFQKASQQLQDSELKSFASKTLPTLQQHLQMAKQADSQATGSTGTESGTTKGSESTQTPSQAQEQPQQEKQN